MANVNFSAAVDDWCRMTDKRMTAVFRESAERVIEEMQKPVGAGGNMPVDTGFLRASLMASTSGLPMMSRSNPGAAASYDGGQVSMVIAGAELGETVYAGYTANYAAHVEYGARGRPPRRFVGLAAQKWPEIVSGAVQDAKSRVK